MDKAKPDDGIYRAIETEAGPRMQPLELSGGPWNPNHQHGGAVAGILTHALEGIESPGPMRLARITIEMFRGVPLSPLRVHTQITRGGRRIQGVEAGLFDGETLVARATGLRIRSDARLPELEAPGEFDSDLGTPPAQPPPPLTRAQLDWMPPYIRAVDIQTVPPERIGEPAMVWTRLLCHFVEGEATSGLVRLAALVDFASGTGNVMDYQEFSSINPDLTIHVIREPRSDWIAIRGRTLRSGDGIGQSAATVYDLEGPVAFVQASLLLDRRENPGGSNARENR